MTSTRPFRIARHARTLVPLLLAAACGAPPPAAAPPTPSPAPSAATQLTVTAPAEDDVAVPITENDPAWGSRRAYVTMVVFSDFQCPFCARLAKTFDTLKAK